jgi:hypothetical protein
VFRRIIKPPDHAAAHFHNRTQILATLAGGIESGNGLIEIHPDPAHQPSSPHQLNQRIP